MRPRFLFRVFVFYAADLHVHETRSAFLGSRDTHVLENYNGREHRKRREKRSDTARAHPWIDWMAAGLRCLGETRVGWGCRVGVPGAGMAVPGPWGLAGILRCLGM